MNLNELTSAYENFFGPPDYLLELPADSQSKDRPKLNIACSFPIPAEGIKETTFVTLGLAMHTMDPACETAELVLSIIGLHSQEENAQIGEALTDLVWGQLKNNYSFAPNTVMKAYSLPLFENMDDLFILDWGHSDPDWLYDVEPNVRLLEVVPVYQSEADELLRLDKSIRTTVFVQSKGDWYYPEREPVQLMKNALANAWHNLKEKARKDNPAGIKELNAGASKTEIDEFEEKINVQLPDDFKDSLQIYNGEIELSDGYKFLTIGQILKTALMMKELQEQGRFSTYKPKESAIGLIQNSWWNRKWIPFAEDGEGNLVCIDLHPGKNGKQGQIIYWERVEGPISSDYGSFFEWLWEFQKTL